MLTLPLTGQKVELKSFVPHGVVAKAQQIAFRGMKIDARMGQATKEELLSEFGESEMAELDQLEKKAYDTRLSELRQEFLKRKLQMDGDVIGAAEEANLVRIEGMVISVDGEKPDKVHEWANELPEPDYQALVEEIARIEENPELKKNGTSSDKPA